MFPNEAIYTIIIMIIPWSTTFNNKEGSIFGNNI